MKVFVLCIVLLTLLRADSYATPPAPITLPNGMRVVVRERRTSPLVGIDLWVRAGARDERSDEEGCAHALEHILFKGTTTRPSGDVDIAIENLGASLHAATGPDFAHFYTTVASAHLADALAVLADVVMNATLPDAEIERERGVILDELAQRDSNPTDKIVDALYARMFDKHSYRRSPGGSAAAIQARKRSELLAFYLRAYGPERCTLALAGDIDAATAREIAYRIFGKWKRRAPVEKSAAPVMAERNAGPEPRAVSFYAPSDKPRLGLGFLAPAASEADMACAALVTAALLGDSDRAGRLAARQLTHTGAEAHYTPRQDTSLFIVTAALPLPVTRPGQKTGVPIDAPERLARLETTLLDTVENLRASPPSLAELNAAKRLLLGRMIMDTETAGGLARAIGYADMTGGDAPETLRARLARLTPDDVLRFARRYLDPAQRVTVRLFPKPSDSVGASLPSPPISPQTERGFRLVKTSPLPSVGQGIVPCRYSLSAPCREYATGSRSVKEVCGQSPSDSPAMVTLTDGVRLILKPEADSEVVAVTVMVRIPPDRTPMEAATGELVARSLFYGSAHRSYELVADSVARVGGSLETLRAPGYVAITCQTVPEQIGEAIYLLCESLKNADFKSEALERAREQILQERERQSANLFETTLRAATGPLRSFPESDGLLLRRVTSDQAVNYFRARYVPARTVITVVGRFHAKQVERTFDNMLFDYDRQPPRSLPLLPDAGHALGNNPLPPPAASALTGSNALALVATAAPDVASPDYPAFRVLHALLGDGHASRLFRRIRDALGIGYHVGALYRAERAEPLVAYLQWDARRSLSTPIIEEKESDAIALRLLQTQLDSVLIDPLTDTEWNRARSVAIGRDALRHERARDRAFLLGWYEAMGPGYAFDADLPKLLAAVTKEEALRVARIYLKTRVTATAIPRLK